MVQLPRSILVFAIACLLTACGDDKPAVRLEAEATIPADARDYFNQMGLHDTRGSKGQVRLNTSGGTVWFDSARTLLTYLRLPETANQPLTAYINIGVAHDQHHRIPGASCVRQSHRPLCARPRTSTRDRAGTGVPTRTCARAGNRPSAECLLPEL